MLTVNVVILYQNRKYYRENMRTVYLLLYKPTLENKKKLNVTNYKHEIHAIAYTFKAGSWQI